jgi:hypothetical protein
MARNWEGSEHTTLRGWEIGIPYESEAPGRFEIVVGQCSVKPWAALLPRPHGEWNDPDPGSDLVLAWPKNGSLADVTVS